MLRYPAVVVGAGVVGLAVARELARKMPVVVVESASAIACGTSSRNSEVVHAGIYYPHGSVKAQTCVEGRRMMYRYCEDKGVRFQRCGKLIVATEEAQTGALEGVLKKARLNDVGDVELISARQAQELEPEVNCVAALLSPSTGIVDSHAYMLALQGDVEAEGGVVALNTHVDAVEISHDGTFQLALVDDKSREPSLLSCDVVINAAGHGAVPLARRIKVERCVMSCR